MHKRHSQLAVVSLQLAGRKISSFKDLIVWQRGMDVAREVYRVTKGLPRAELYGLTSQMRRSAVSIPSNIAEGRRRGTKKDYVQFLRIADGSASELETQLLLVQELYSLDIQLAQRLVEEVQKMLGAMIIKLQAAT